MNAEAREAGSAYFVISFVYAYAVYMRDKCISCYATYHGLGLVITKYFGIHLLRSVFRIHHTYIVCGLSEDVRTRANTLI